MRRFILAALALSIALVFAEGVTRVFVRVDRDGQRWLGERRLRPWRIPSGVVEERQRALRDPGSLFVYDADLGWAPRPGARSADARVTIDARGARHDGARTGTQAPDLRIVTIGDSFTFGDEVGDRETWPARLEALLVAEGRRAEVVNLGVNGFGLDQAVLRFERDGVAMQPDVVLLGLQPENLLRNSNVLRPVFFPGTGLPLSKPRFVRRGDTWVVFNQPAAGPEEVLATVRAPRDAPLLEHEGWWDDRFRAGPWQASVLASLVATVLWPPEAAAGFRMTPTRADLGTFLVDRLASAVADGGARLVVVHLPRREDLEDIVAGREPWYGPWLEELERRYAVVRPEVGLATVDEADFESGGHYGPRGNDLVARAVRDHLGASPVVRDGPAEAVGGPAEAVGGPAEAVGGPAERQGRPGGRGSRMSTTRMVGLLQPSPGRRGANST